jgi:hypothetical protein
MKTVTITYSRIPNTPATEKQPELAVKNDIRDSETFPPGLGSRRSARPFTIAPVEIVIISGGIFR